MRRSPATVAIFVLVTALITGSVIPATGEWARLNDGSIVKVESKRGGQVAFRRSDGSRGTIDRQEVDGFLQPVAAIRIVDQVIEQIGKPEHHDAVRTKLKQIGMAAVPQLLVHLRARKLETRQAAMAALQMVWSKEAEAPVVALLDHEDDYLRRMALRLIHRHVPQEERLRIFSPLADASNDPHLAGHALAAVLSAAPDSEKMRTALEDPALWGSIHYLLPRYQSAAFIPSSRRLLRDGSAEEKASALTALIYQMDDAKETRTAVAALLQASSAPLRELAAEYLRWHGTGEELSHLESHIRSENDRFAKASMTAAIDTIMKRGVQWTATPGEASEATVIDPWPNKERDVYLEGIRRLREQPSLATRRRVLDQLLQTAPIEPRFEFAETWRLRPDPRNQPRLDLLNLAFGYATSKERKARRRAAFGAKTTVNAVDVPIADGLLPPIRDYFDPKRKSFGVFVAPGDGPFANSHHMGDDVAFGRQQRTIVAIGDGLVRLAHSGQSSWGGLVVIEHQDKDGTFFCSLYGHLGPLIHVMPGDSVRRGDKLGTLGRDHVFATGGFRTHLHFGIHRSDFENNGRPWVGGYLGPERFKDDTSNRWADPQAFLKARLATP